jgi:uncharacterized protein
MTWAEIALLMLGALAGGFVNGLTGFGTALTALPIWLQVLPPAQAAALGAAAGCTGQVMTLHLIRQAIDWRKVAPFVLAGLAGVPIGTWMVPMIDIRLFKLGVGAVLVVYCGFCLIAHKLSPTLGDLDGSRGGRWADAAIGFGGGVMSGLAGLSGPLPVIWATFKPWNRDQKRTLFQVFNFTILAATLLSSAVAGLLPRSFWTMALLIVPATFVGVMLGGYVYRRLDDRRFDRLVLTILLGTGIVLISANL